MIRPLVIACEDASLAATLHPGAGARAALIVSGGVQTRAGPHRLFTQIAEALSRSGIAALRFDRRGVGDSEGEDAGFLRSEADIAAAASALRHESGASEIVGIGLCDGAAALALFGAQGAANRLVLLNPWSFESDTAEMPAALQRERTVRRLLNPRAWPRVLAGKVDVAAALKSMLGGSKAPAQSAFAARLVAAINAFPGPVLVVLSGRDATAGAFSALRPALGKHVAWVRIENADHTFTQPEARRALLAAVTGWLAP
ncbi:hydrolase 1, exosortase A system-associated [Sphingosinicella soli]|nr:hydrolase 1, exosortase A system-associated [Sphingosinicella soli]